MVLAMVGCGSVTKSLITEQEWSENYAAAEGVEATSPMMVDGDLGTFGETQSPGGSTTTAFSEAIVELPERISIRKVILYTPNIRSFSLYAAGERDDEWLLIDEMTNNEGEMVSRKVSEVTDKIKVRVRKTSDDKVIPGGGRRSRMRYAKGKIQEIEIYGLVGKDEVQVSEQSAPAGVPGAPAGVPGAPAQIPAEIPKTAPAVLSLESPQSTYTLAGPVLVKISLRTGPDDLVVLGDHVADEMLITKLLVKTASGEEVACAKPTPGLSRPRPYRGSGRPVNIRDARTLDADSIITVDIPNLLEYYPMKEQGTYTVQLDLQLEVHDSFVGRAQTEIDDINSTIRAVNAKSNYSQTERSAIIADLQADINRLKNAKGSRYLVVGSRGKPLDLSSNVLEVTLQ